MSVRGESSAAAAAAAGMERGDRGTPSAARHRPSGAPSPGLTPTAAPEPRQMEAALSASPPGRGEAARAEPAPEVFPKQQ